MRSHTPDACWLSLCFHNCSSHKKSTGFAPGIVNNHHRHGHLCCCCSSPLSPSFLWWRCKVSLNMHRHHKLSASNCVVGEPARKFIKAAPRRAHITTSEAFFGVCNIASSVSL